MNVQMLTNKLPRKSFALLAACLGGLLLFIFAGIIPMQISIQRMDDQIEKTRYTIDEQQDFAPIYEAFQKRIRQGENRSGSALVLPKSEKLSRDKVPDLSRIMRDIALKAGMTNVSVTPQLNTTDATPSVSVNHNIQGSYINFRKYLMYMAQLPYYRDIDSIKIKGTENGLGFTVRLRFFVA